MSEIEVFTRTFEPEFEVLPRAKGGDGRTIVGIAVPYDRPMRINAQLVEQFDRGAFNHQVDAALRIPFSRDHLSPQRSTGVIGRTQMLRDDPVGLVGHWRVSATPLGDETLELVKDGALSHLSIAFRERQNRRLPGGVVGRVKADLQHVAVVAEGAYGDSAAVSDVRSATDQLRDQQLAEIRKILESAQVPHATA